ncbi:MAG: ABC transporter permease [Chloroflexi bacterium]|nr:ABC transporter permease [Chloroflexota bacterium]
MKLHQLILKDMLRRKKRVLYATLGVVIASMTVVGILTVSVAGRDRIYGQLEKYGANLSVVPATRSLTTGLGDLTLGSVTLGENYITEDKIPLIRKMADGEIKRSLNLDTPDNIAVIAPQLLVQGELKGIPVIFAGIDPQETTVIKTWWEVTRGKYFDGEEQAVIGPLAAELLKIDIGDTIVLNNSSEVTVVGILDETGSNEDYQVFIPLPVLQRSFNKEGLVSIIDIRALCTACPVEIIADAINNNISGVRAVAVKQVAATEMGMLEKINNFMLALAGITLMVGGFGVVNALMASVHQRIKDIGIMRAVGASRNQIIKAFMYEALIIGLLGGILGYAAGTLLAYAIGPLIFEGSSIVVVAQYLPLSIVLAVVLATAATLYPAFSATRIRVADSFRSL